MKKEKITIVEFTCKVEILTSKESGAIRGGGDNTNLQGNEFTSSPSIPKIQSYNIDCNE